MADLSKVQPGRGLRIPAADYNAMIDAARAHQASQFNGGSRPAFQPRAADIIKVKNGTDAARERYEVLAVSSPIVTPTAGASEFKRQVALTATTPASGDEGLWVVLLDPLAPGAIGRAIAAGVAQVRIDVTAGTASYEQAECDSGSYNLVLSSTGSAKVLWREDGTSGEKWAVVRLGAAAAASSTGSDETGVAFPQTGRDYVSLPTLASGYTAFRWRDGSGTIDATFHVAAELANTNRPIPHDTGGSLIQNAYYLIPFVAKRSTVTRIGIPVDVFYNNDLRIGIYTDHHTQDAGGIHYPNELIHESSSFTWTQSDVSLGGSNGMYTTAALSVSLTARALYWIACCFTWTTNVRFGYIGVDAYMPTLGYQNIRYDASALNLTVPMVALYYASGGVTIPTSAFPDPFPGTPASPQSGVELVAGTTFGTSPLKQFLPAVMVAYGA